MTKPRKRSPGALLALVLFAACERDALVGADRTIIAGRADGGAGASSSGGTASIDGAAHPCVPTPCQGHLYACGNCQDDDGDGLVDMDDPDCLGPCHNAEDTFFGNIPGQDHSACAEDCYFDQDSGPGNDGCNWSHVCDPLAVAPDFPPAGSKCAYDPQATLPRGTKCSDALTSQDPECTTVCGPLTPNGCDCFGCCNVPGATTPAVFLGSVDDAGNPTCDLAHVSDPTRCKPCTQVAACKNPCEECELCVGKRTLPASCAPGIACPAPSCPRGLPCGSPCLPPCPTGEACVTGCCVAPPR